MTAISGCTVTAQAIAAHESPRTTKLYDRRGRFSALQERLGLPLEDIANMATVT